LEVCLIGPFVLAALPGNSLKSIALASATK
jgi:hypothetical protein